MNKRKSLPYFLLVLLVFLALTGDGTLSQAETISPQLALEDPGGKTLWYDGTLLGVE